jgi:replicative DNA helicase
MQICDRYKSAMSEHQEDAMAIFAKLQMEFMELAVGKSNQNSQMVGEIVPGVIEDIARERLNPSRDEALGFTYGITEFDKMTKGMFAGEYTLILAETGGAKTVWLTQILLDNALKGIRSKMFSMEMKKKQIVRRMLASISRIVKAKEIRDPRWMDFLSFEDLQKTGMALSKLGIDIDDSRQLPLDQMLARSRVAIQRDKVQIIGVDYLQLMKAPTTYKRMTDTERIEMITLALRDLAADGLDYGVHVVALSQYSRPADGGRGKAENGRAKGSSSLEQSCQIMAHIVRERLEDKSLSTDVEIILGKNREGRFGSIKCVLDEDHLRFQPATAA